MFHIHRMFHHCWVIYKADGERAGRTPGPVLLTSGWSEAGQFGPSHQHFDILSLLSDSAVIYVNTSGQSSSGPVQQELQWFWTGSSQWEGPVQWRRDQWEHFCSSECLRSSRWLIQGKKSHHASVTHMSTWSHLQEELCVWWVYWSSSSPAGDILYFHYCW